jgi:Flp pilus assembly protein TadB
LIETSLLRPKVKQLEDNPMRTLADMMGSISFTIITMAILCAFLIMATVAVAVGVPYLYWRDHDSRRLADLQHRLAKSAPSALSRSKPKH